MTKNTINKLLEIKNFLGFKRDSDFAKFLGKQPSDIDKYLKGTRNVGFRLIQDLKAKIPNLNEKYFFDDLEPIINEAISHQPNDYQNDSEGITVRNLPIYGKVSAGAAIGMWEYENKPAHQVGISHYRVNDIKDKIYGFTVFGDSMRDRLRDGDEVAAIKLDFETKKPRDGDIVVVFFNTDPEITEPTIKLFQWIDKVKGDFILKSINPYHKDIISNKKKILKIFRVIFNISFVDYRENRS